MKITETENAVIVQYVISFNEFDKRLKENLDTKEIGWNNELIKIKKNIINKPIILYLYKSKTPNFISYWVTEMKISGNKLVFITDVVITKVNQYSNLLWKHL